MSVTKLRVFVLAFYIKCKRVPTDIDISWGSHHTMYIKFNDGDEN